MIKDKTPTPTLLPTSPRNSDMNADISKTDTSIQNVTESSNVNTQQQQKQQEQAEQGPPKRSDSASDLGFHVMRQQNAGNSAIPSYFGVPFGKSLGTPSTIVFEKALTELESKLSTVQTPNFNLFDLSLEDPSVLKLKNSFNVLEPAQVTSEGGPFSTVTDSGVIAALLMLYLRLLPHPFIPVDYYFTAIRVAGVECARASLSQMRIVISRLSDTSRCLLIKLCRLLEKTKIPVGALAAKFTNFILRESNVFPSYVSLNPLAVKFVNYLITYVDYIGMDADDYTLVNNPIINNGIPSNDAEPSIKDFITNGIALYDFNGTDNSTLSFKKDQKITLIAAHKNDWVQGVIDENVGFLPSSYIQLIPLEAPAVVKPKSVLQPQTQQQQQQQAMSGNIFGDQNQRMQPMNAMMMMSNKANTQNAMLQQQQQQQQGGVAVNNSSSNGLVKNGLTPQQQQQLMQQQKMKQVQLQQQRVKIMMEQQLLQQHQQQPGQQLQKTQHQHGQQPMQVAGNGLPPGWIMAKNQQGRIYYIDTINKKSQWDKPQMNATLRGTRNQMSQQMMINAQLKQQQSGQLGQSGQPQQVQQPQQQQQQQPGKLGEDDIQKRMEQLRLAEEQLIQQQMQMQAQQANLVRKARELEARSKLEELKSETPNWQIAYEELELESKIGEGGFGEVFRGKWRGTTVAVKTLKGGGPSLNPKEVEKFSKEVSILRALHHPNLVLFLGACLSPTLCMVSEFMFGGSLYDLLYKKKRIPDTQKRYNLVLDIARAMAYLHNCKPTIIHRDLKSLNILLDEKGDHAKVCDVGLARLKTDEQTITGAVGTFSWMPPEMMKNMPYTEKVDVYSFGLVVYEIVTGKLPFAGLPPPQVSLRVAVHDERPPLPQMTPRHWKDLIVRCWQTDDKLRPSFIEIIDILGTNDFRKS